MSAAMMASLSKALQGSDNDKKVAALGELEKELKNENAEIQDVLQLTSILRLAVRSANSHVSTSGLACLPFFFPHLSQLQHHASGSSDRKASVSLAPSAQSHLPPRSRSAVPWTSRGPTAYNLKQALVALLPMDKLGDGKEKVRELARASVIEGAIASLTFGTHSSPANEAKSPWIYLQKILVEQGFQSKNPRTREQSVYCLLSIRGSGVQPPAPLRPFTPSLLTLLKDADSAVRSLALFATISVFSSPTVLPAAKADLKRELSKQNVPKKVVDHILEAVLGGGAMMERSASNSSLATTEFAFTATTGSQRSASDVSEVSSLGLGQPPLPASAAASRSPTTSPKISQRPPPAALQSRGSVTSLPSTLSSLPAAAFPPSEVPAGPITDIETVYVASDRDLERDLTAMHPAFEGKEDENNWKLRDAAVARMRGMIKGGVKDSYPDAFLEGVKHLQTGILKTASSLRTTVANSALALISELAIAFGPRLAPIAEGFFVHCLGMAGLTKKIVASNSQEAVSNIISHLPFHFKYLQLIVLALDEKIPAARGFMIAHLSILLRTHGRHSMHHIETIGGLELLDKSVRKGLADANTAVKEASRRLYWQFVEVWPQYKSPIRDSLDVSAQKQLGKANPATLVADAAAAGAKPAIPPKAAGRPSMRDMIAKAKKEKEAAENGGELPAPAVEAAAKGKEKEQDPFSTPPPSVPSSPPLPAVVVPPPPPPPPVASSSTATPPTLRKASTSAAIVSSSSLSPSPRGLGAIPRPKSAYGSLPRPPKTSSEAGDNKMPARPPSAFGAASPRSILVSNTPQSQRRYPATHSSIPTPTRRSSSRAGNYPLSPTLSAVGRSPVLSSSMPAGHLNGRTRTRGGSTSTVGSDRYGREISPFNLAAVESANGHSRVQGPAKVQRTRIPPPADTPERADQIDSLVSSLQSNQINEEGLQELAALSRERVAIRDTSAIMPEQIDYYLFWEGKQRMPRILEGLQTLLLKPDESARYDLALALLKSLVEKQGPCFEGDEVLVLSFLLNLREISTSKKYMGPVEVITDRYCAQIDPLQGLNALRASMVMMQQKHDGVEKLHAWALGLRHCAKFLERLPPAQMERESPKVIALLKGSSDGLFS